MYRITQNSFEPKWVNLVFRSYTGVFESTQACDKDMNAWIATPALSPFLYLYTIETQLPGPKRLHAFVVTNCRDVVDIEVGDTMLQT
jgi:hypothetical protein